MNTVVSDNKYCFQEICRNIFEYNHISGKFDSQTSAEITLPCAKEMNAQGYASVGLEKATGPQFSAMYSSKQKSVPQLTCMYSLLHELDYTGL